MKQKFRRVFIMETVSARMPPPNPSVPENISDSLTTYSTLPHFQFCPHYDKCHLFRGRIHCMSFSTTHK